MGNVLLAASLNENLQEIINKLSELMDSFWIYIVMALAAVVVIWGAYELPLRTGTRRRSTQGIW